MGLWRVGVEAALLDGTEIIENALKKGITITVVRGDLDTVLSPSGLVHFGELAKEYPDLVNIIDFDILTHYLVSAYPSKLADKLKEA
ncbi:MAG: hypothetical protein Q9M91_08160 [Candidatus Dojkabacteria bacterium]|nr:hypothetical protein [Candidatus Dojkabacteria bacterium]MDQ7021752.1 hypothetical protein [Candidatus Dojkabacteria bacterium]